MKKIFTFLFALVATTVLWAHNFEVNGIYYNILADKTNEVEVTYEGDDYYSYYDEYSGSVSIPETVTYDGTTYSVTSIGDGAFYGCSGLTSVTIGNSVTSIGDWAFDGCSSLTSPVYNAHCFAYMPTSFEGAYSIPDGIKQIAGTAFYRCFSLTSITIPNSVTSIGGWAFYLCYGLTSITIPNSVTSIGEYAFYECYGLTSITIPNSVTSIGNHAFSGLTSIVVEEGNTMYDSRENCNAIIETASNTLITGCKNTIIPNSVTSIGDDAFYYCSGLISITIPNSVTSIGYSAFSGCSGLTSIVVEEGNTVYDSRENCNAIIETASNTLIMGCKNTIIPNTVTSIGDDAFGGCSGLTSITIPNSVTSIGEWAFYYCRSLTSITIPNSVTSIGGSAFQYCSGLTSITIPNSVTSIGNSAFSGCSSLPVENNLRYADTYLVEAVDKTLSTYSIKEGTKWIGDDAFDRCSGLTSITIPNSVISIGNYAFEDCSSLASITIPNSVTSIGSSAFYRCTSLTSITIPNSITSIEESAFLACSGLTSVVVEEGNTVYDSRENCNAIIETASNTLITGCKNTIIPNTVTSIGASAFYQCYGLTFVTIPNSVTSIGSSAFSVCSSLTSIVVEEGNTVYDSRENCNAIIETASNMLITGCKNTIIPNSVTSIGNQAFCYCRSLTSITIPNSVTSIGGSAFQYCSGLTSITIPNSVTSIGDYAFYRCTSLTSITIPNSVTSIGESAFEVCSSLPVENNLRYADTYLVEAVDKTLSTYSIKEGTKWIGSSAFYNCSGLTSITIPNSVTSIGYRAFAYCYYLEKVSFEGKTPPTMGEDIFYQSNPTWVVPCGAYDVYASTEIAQQYGYAIEEYCNGGECGDYLTWTYDEDTHELAISGMHEMYDYVGSGPWGAYVNEITSITMEEGITYIGTDAFANCKYVQSLTIPASVEKIGNSAFENCRKLNEVNFAEDGALTEIGDWAFYNCHNLQDLTIPEGVTQLGDAAFFNCTYLKELTLPSTLMAVADNGFALCEKLAKMNVKAAIPPVAEARTFENVNRNIPVFVPTESVAAYKSAPIWQEFNIQGKDNVETDLENISSDNGYGVMENGKILRDGQLIIIRDGVEYNTLGQAL